jgi:hypothetical protein
MEFKLQSVTYIWTDILLLFLLLWSVGRLSGGSLFFLLGFLLGLLVGLHPPLQLTATQEVLINGHCSQQREHTSS